MSLLRALLLSDDALKLLPLLGLLSRGLRLLDGPRSVQRASNALADVVAVPSTSVGRRLPLVVVGLEEAVERAPLARVLGVETRVLRAANRASTSLRQVLLLERNVVDHGEGGLSEHKESAQQRQSTVVCVSTRR